MLKKPTYESRCEVADAIYKPDRGFLPLEDLDQGGVEAVALNHLSK